MKNAGRESSKKAPWHLWLIALTFIYIYANGIYDYFMMLSHNEDYYNSKGFGTEVHLYFTDYPLPFLALWTINIFSSPIAGILIIFRSRWSVNVAFISFLSMLLLEILTFTLRDRWNTLGQWISLFDIILLLLTFGFYWYSRWLKERLILN